VRSCHSQMCPATGAKLTLSTRTGQLQSVLEILTRDNQGRPPHDAAPAEELPAAAGTTLPRQGQGLERQVRPAGTIPAVRGTRRRCCLPPLPRRARRAKEPARHHHRRDRGRRSAAAARRARCQAPVHARGRNALGGFHHRRVCDFRRLPRAPSFMAFTGLVPSEHSRGPSVHRGSITKTGNAHLRRVLVEAAWSYRHRPAIGINLRRRSQGQPPRGPRQRMGGPVPSLLQVPLHRPNEEPQRGRGSPSRGSSLGSSGVS